MQLVVGGSVVMTGAVVGMRVVLGTVDDIMGVELAIPNFASVAPLLSDVVITSLIVIMIWQILTF